jgi:PrcB C-terminal
MTATGKKLALRPPVFASVAITSAYLLTACVAAPVAPEVVSKKNQVLAKMAFSECPIQQLSNVSGGVAASPFTAQMIRNEKEWLAKTQDPLTQLSDARSWRVSGANQIVLIIDGGRKPSSGYALEMLDYKLDSSKTNLQIQVKETQPEKGSVNAAMMAKPCLMLHVNIEGIKKISVTDAKGAKLDIAL